MFDSRSELSRGPPAPGPRILPEGYSVALKLFLPGLGHIDGPADRVFELPLRLLPAERAPGDAPQPRDLPIGKLLGLKSLVPLPTIVGAMA
jgi:hypothetical protein